MSVTGTGTSSSRYAPASTVGVGFRVGFSLMTGLSPQKQSAQDPTRPCDRAGVPEELPEIFQGRSSGRPNASGRLLGGLLRCGLLGRSLLRGGGGLLGRSLLRRGGGRLGGGLLLGIALSATARAATRAPGLGGFHRGAERGHQVDDLGALGLLFLGLRDRYAGGLRLDDLLQRVPVLVVVLVRVELPAQGVDVRL